MSNNNGLFIPRPGYKPSEGKQKLIDLLSAVQSNAMLLLVEEHNNEFQRSVGLVNGDYFQGIGFNTDDGQVMFGYIWEFDLPNGKAYHNIAVYVDGERVPREHTKNTLWTIHKQITVKRKSIIGNPA